MTVEQYKQLAADLRSHMEEPIPFERPNCPTATKVSAYLPGGEEKSMVPEPPSFEDLTHLNPTNTRAKLTSENVLDIRTRCSAGNITQHSLALEFGVTDALISKIVLRKSWKASHKAEAAGQRNRRRPKR